MCKNTIVAMIAAVSLVGCGSNAVGPNVPQPPQIAGAFVGTITPDPGQTSPKVSTTVIFSNEVAGANQTATVNGAANLTVGCGITAVLNGGAITGQKLDGTLATNDGGQIKFVNVAIRDGGTNAANLIPAGHIFGPVTVTGGACDGETGTIDLVKQ